MNKMETKPSLPDFEEEQGVGWRVGGPRERIDWLHL